MFLGFTPPRAPKLEPLVSWDAFVSHVYYLSSFIFHSPPIAVGTMETNTRAQRPRNVSSRTCSLPREADRARGDKGPSLMVGNGEVAVVRFEARVGIYGAWVGEEWAGCP